MPSLVLVFVMLFCNCPVQGFGPSFNLVVFSAFGVNAWAGLWERGNIPIAKLAIYSTDLDTSALSLKAFVVGLRLSVLIFPWMVPGWRTCSRLVCIFISLGGPRVASLFTNLRPVIFPWLDPRMVRFSWFTTEVANIVRVKGHMLWKVIGRALQMANLPGCSFFTV